MLLILCRTINLGRLTRALAKGRDVFCGGFLTACGDDQDTQATGGPRPTVAVAVAPANSQPIQEEASRNHIFRRGRCRVLTLQPARQCGRFYQRCGGPGQNRGSRPGRGLSADAPTYMRTRAMAARRCSAVRVSRWRWRRMTGSTATSSSRLRKTPPDLGLRILRAGPLLWPGYRCRVVCSGPRRGINGAGDSGC